MSSKRTPSGPSPDGGRDAEASGGPSPEPSTPAVTPGLAARRVLRSVDRATLATAMRAAGPDTTPIGDRGADGEGWPYPSLVLTALDHDATPLLLMSTLAQHTRNIAADDRVGLLFDGTGDLAQPLAGARVGVLGRAVRSDAPHHRARFRARHPAAAHYMDFADFAVYRVAVERAHLVAGFGRVHWIDGPEALLAAPAPDFAAVEAALLDVRGPDGDWPDGWRLTGIDPEGLDLRRDGAVARREFAAPVAGLEAARLAVAAVRAAFRAAFRAAWPPGGGGP